MVLNINLLEIADMVELNVPGSKARRASVTKRTVLLSLWGLSRLDNCMAESCAFRPVGFVTSSLTVKSSWYDALQSWMAHKSQHEAEGGGGSSLMWLKCQETFVVVFLSHSTTLIWDTQINNEWAKVYYHHHHHQNEHYTQKDTEFW